MCVCTSAIYMQRTVIQRPCIYNIIYVYKFFVQLDPRSFSSRTPSPLVLRVSPFDRYANPLSLPDSRLFSPEQWICTYTCTQIQYSQTWIYQRVAESSDVFPAVSTDTILMGYRMLRWPIVARKECVSNTNLVLVPHSRRQHLE